jgi:hypothetical protein
MQTKHHTHKYKINIKINIKVNIIISTYISTIIIITINTIYSSLVYIINVM